MVDDLVDQLNVQGYSADRLHGDMTQVMRDRVMNKFRKSGLEFLVATDVAARGIDVDDVQVVFNYDLPYDVEDYLHRIGRTGRAGRSGRAISFVAGREIFQIHAIERFTKVKIQRGKPPTAGQVEEARVQVFLDKLRATLTSGDFKKQDHVTERLLEEGFSSTDIASALMHQLFQGDVTSNTKKAPREREEERPARPAMRDDREQRFNAKPDYPPRVAPRGREDREQRVHAKQDYPPRTPWKKPATAAAPAPRVAPRVETVIAPPVKAVTSRPTVAIPLPGSKLKKSRKTPMEQTRLWINVGDEMGIAPIDIVNAVAGETGLPGKVVGTIDVRERHLFADVASEHANAIISRLNRSELKGHKLKVKLA